jgi:ribonuclease HII
VTTATGARREGASSGRATTRGTGRGGAPSLRVEKRLLRSGHTLLAACDEVGRGALGGPVTVGMVLVDTSVQRPLAGVRDSKLLTPAARVALVPRIRRWVVGYAVGHATAAEIDEHGIIAALRMAGHRAMAALPAHPDVVLLDGNHDWLSRPRQPSLFDDTPFADARAPVVRTMIKADLQCSSVAAASVLAKTERDAIMVRLGSLHPGYGWDENKGYSTAAHTEALRRLGPCVHHRQSWRLPELVGPESDALFDLAPADPFGPDLGDPFEPDLADPFETGPAAPPTGWDLGDDVLDDELGDDPGDDDVEPDDELRDAGVGDPAPRAWSMMDA